MLQENQKEVTLSRFIDGGDCTWIVPVDEENSLIFNEGGRGNMNRKEILEKLEDLAKEAGARKDSLDIAACLRVFILGAAKKDKFLLKFLESYSHLNYANEDRDLWEILHQRGLKKKDRDIALQIRSFLLNSLRMSPKDPDFSRIKKEAMSDPPIYNSFFQLLDRGGLEVSEMKTFQMRELVETHMKNRT